MDGDLVVSSHHVDFGENGASEELVVVVMDMPDGVAFCSLGICNYYRGATRFLWVRYVVPKTMNSGVAGCAILQHGVKLVFGDGEPV
jgi:hypothetical protein